MVCVCGGGSDNDGTIGVRVRLWGVCEGEVKVVAQSRKMEIDLIERKNVRTTTKKRFVVRKSSLSVQHSSHSIITLSRDRNTRAEHIFSRPFGVYRFRIIPRRSPRKYVIILTLNSNTPVVPCRTLFILLWDFHRKGEGKKRPVVPRWHPRLD